MGKRKNAANQSAQSYERQLRFGSMMRKLLLPSGSRRWITPIIMLLLLLGIIARRVHRPFGDATACAT